MKKLVFIVICFCLFSCGSSDNENVGYLPSDYKSEKSKDESFKNKVYVISQTFVKRKLTSPSTADFPLLDFEYNDLGNDKHEITGSVESKNNFNATITNNFNIVLKFNGGDWSDENNWEVTWLKFN